MAITPDQHPLKLTHRLPRCKACRYPSSLSVYLSLNSSSYSATFSTIMFMLQRIRSTFPNVNGGEQRGVGRSRREELAPQLNSWSGVGVSIWRLCM